MAIERHPEHARLYAVRGSLLLEQGRVAPALADLERFLKISTNEDWNRQAQDLLQALRDPEATPTLPAPNPHR